MNFSEKLSKVVKLCLDIVENGEYDNVKVIKPSNTYGRVWLINFTLVTQEPEDTTNSSNGGDYYETMDLLIAFDEINWFITPLSKTTNHLAYSDYNYQGGEISNDVDFSEAINMIYEHFIDEYENEKEQENY